MIDKSTNEIRTVVGTGKPGSGKDGISATKSAMLEPNDCAIDNDGHLLIADVRDQRIRKFDPITGTITTVAGTGVKEHTGDDGPAITAGIFGAATMFLLAWWLILTGNTEGPTTLLERVYIGYSFTPL